MTAQTRNFDDLAIPAAARQTARPRSEGQPSALARRRVKKSPSAEYWLVFGVCLAVFVVVLALERLLPRSWRTISAQFDATWVLTEAVAAAYRYTDIAFQG